MTIFGRNIQKTLFRIEFAYLSFHVGLLFIKFIRFKVGAFFLRHSLFIIHINDLLEVCDIFVYADDDAKNS